VIDNLVVFLTRTKYAWPRLQETLVRIAKSTEVKGYVQVNAVNVLAKHDVPDNVFVDFLKSSNRGVQETSFGVLISRQHRAAVWTRLNPKEARNRAASHPEEIFEVLVYMAAVASAPRADDPDPRVLDIAFSHLLDAFAKSKRGNMSAEFVMTDSAASVLAAPRTAPRFCQVLMSPSFRGELYRDPQSVWKVAHAEALFDMKAAADLLLALKTSYYAQQLEPPDFVLANVRKLFRLGLDLKKLDESQEPGAKVRAARFEWMHNPSKAIMDVLPVIRSMAPSMTAEDRDQLILQALPILASEVPQEAEQFAATIHDPARRSEAYSWLAMFSHNGGAAQMLFSGQLSVEAEPFLLEQDMLFGKH
jgi:hypothetical protein